VRLTEEMKEEPSKEVKKKLARKYWDKGIEKDEY
jgi:hypothetical protein